MQTALTRLLGVRVPLVCPPMAGAAGGALAAAVTRGGGFGFVAAGHTPLSSLLNELDIGRKMLQLKQSDPLPFGIGLIAWRLEASHGDPNQAEGFLKAIVDARPAAVWVSFGEKLEEWVRRVRKTEMERTPGFRTKIFVMIGSEADGKKVSKWDIDVVVVQGTESGGHGPTYQSGLPLHTLLPILSPFFKALPSPAPLLLPAGGIVNGTQLLSILPFCSGAVMGTVFVATPESLYSQAQKELLVRSDGSDTIRTDKFDKARGTLGWGAAVDGRGLKNLTTEEEIVSKEKYSEAATNGDIQRIVTWAGSSVGLVKAITPAQVLVGEIEQEALNGLRELVKMQENE